MTAGLKGSEGFHLQPPKLPQPAPPTGHQVSKGLRLWGTFLIRSSTGGVLPWDAEVQAAIVPRVQGRTRAGDPGGLSGKQAGWARETRMPKLQVQMTES